MKSLQVYLISEAKSSRALEKLVLEMLPEESMRMARSMRFWHPTCRFRLLCDGVTSSVAAAAGSCTCRVLAEGEPKLPNMRPRRMAFSGREGGPTTLQYVTFRGVHV